MQMAEGGPAAPPTNRRLPIAKRSRGRRIPPEHRLYGQSTGEERSEPAGGSSHGAGVAGLRAAGR